MICPACYDDKLQIGWIIAKGSYKELKKQGEETWISEIQKTCPPELFDHLERSKGNMSNKFVLDGIKLRILESQIGFTLLPKL